MEKNSMQVEKSYFPLPILAITLGDPAGIGPEIILKALNTPHIFDKCRPLIIGDRRILQRAADVLGMDVGRYEIVTEPSKAVYTAGSVTLVDLVNAVPAMCPVGKLSVESGKAAVEYVLHACDLAMQGRVDAIVTAPLNKEAINLAGFHYAGHTEILTEHTHAQNVSMLLTGPKMRVVHVSTHVSLEEAIGRVTQKRVKEVIWLAHTACLALGIAQPRIAVAGLNPHAGENGLFGHQESQEIMPAILEARAAGLLVTDPQPPDTVFLRMTKGEFDIVVAMYHDQGHIPMKLLGFDEGVNVSIGLPIIRTSVDHGTAFDIAGKGIASANSLLAAVNVACQMVSARNRSEN
jgi:4-phospho-D-threonate 3-dehydrogenase / 4-phospho-D-erythronate 3-dehydrogenase